MPERPKNLMEHAYDDIKRRLMVLDLEPGAPIDDFQISKELGTSRTPVREALFKLASESLVTSNKRGFFARPFDIMDLSSFFEAHMVLARAIARLTAVNATEADLAALRNAEKEVQDAIRRRKPEEVASTNAKLHQIEATSSKNPFLSVAASNIHDHAQRLGYIAFGGVTSWDRLKDHFAQVEQEHSEIVAAYEDRNPDRAEELAAQHVLLLRKRIVDYMTEDNARDAYFGGDVLTSVRID